MMKVKRLILISITSTLLLLIPLIAMQFTDEVNWTLSDFIVAVVLLFGAGVLCEFVFRKVGESKYRTFVIIIIIVVFLLIWAEFAVGVFGTPFGGN